MEKLKETKYRFGYEPHEWQLQAALKVLEGNDGVVVAGTGKGKTMAFALLGLAVQLSKTNRGHYIIVSPLKALEGDQVCPQSTRKGGVNCWLTPPVSTGRSNEKAGHRGLTPCAERLWTTSHSPSKT